MSMAPYLIPGKRMMRAVDPVTSTPIINHGDAPRTNADIVAWDVNNPSDTFPKD
jgi:hypothetical protein